MRIIAPPLIAIFIVLVISGCVSVEELSRQDSKTLAEHKGIFVECKAKARAHREWLTQKKSALMKPREIASKVSKTYGGCFEEKLPGLLFSHTTSTTSLDIYSKSSMMFRYTEGDHLVEKFFERSRKWDRHLHEGKEPWDGYWFQYNEALVKWENKFKGSN